MFGMGKGATTPEKRAACNEVSMRRADEERIRAAAAATGLPEADFIRQAALLPAREVEQRLLLSILPIEAFEAFRTAVAGRGKAVPGLARAAQASEGLLKETD